MGGGTNEDEEMITLDYQVLKGSVTTKRIHPLKVRGTNSEGTIYTLDTFVLYPTTDTALIKIIRTGRNNQQNIIRLVKSVNHKKMFKFRRL